MILLDAPKCILFKLIYTKKAPESRRYVEILVTFLEEYYKKQNISLEFEPDEFFCIQRPNKFAYY